MILEAAPASLRENSDAALHLRIIYGGLTENPQRLRRGPLRGAAVDFHVFAKTTQAHRGFSTHAHRSSVFTEAKQSICKQRTGDSQTTHRRLMGSSQRTHSRFTEKSHRICKRLAADLLQMGLTHHW